METKIKTEQRVPNSPGQKKEMTLCNGIKIVPKTTVSDAFELWMVYCAEDLFTVKSE